MKILIITEQGKVLKTDANQFPDQARGGVGVRGINLKKGDKVVSVISIKE